MKNVQKLLERTAHFPCEWVHLRYTCINWLCLQTREKLIVARDCHQSVINAMMLFDIKPVYIYPDIIEEFGIVGVISLEDVENAIKDNPDCTGVLLQGLHTTGCVVILRPFLKLFIDTIKFS